MLMVGLTGGIGAGKSAVATRLADRGAVLIDSDRIARDVVAPGTGGLRAVTAEFGDGVLAADGSLDRPALAATVFGDDGARRRLEGIIHPLVRARSAELAAAAAPDAIVVNDVPLLVETGLVGTYHLVVVVEASLDVRVDRLVGGRGMTPQQAQARIRAQAGDAARRAAADVLIVNDGSLAELDSQVAALWERRLVPYEANLRHRRPVPPPVPARLTDPDPSWSEQADRLVARVRRAAGQPPVRVDHIGLTAVPGLPADDLIQLQIGVESLAQADRIAAPLAAAGFPPVPGPGAAGGDGAAVAGADGAAVAGADGAAVAGEPGRRHAVAGEPERLHAGADPGRPVLLRVRLRGSPAWRRALLVRDHLRAEPARRDAYADAVRQWAGGPTTGTAAADPPWRREPPPDDDEHVAAQKWAAATGWQP